MDSSELSHKDLKLKALRLCQEFIGSSWNEIEINDFEFTTVSGGLSNTLYCCTLSDSIKINDTNTPRRVLLRIYGIRQDDSHLVVVESTTFMLLSERKLGPKLYGIFPGGRLEEYIPSKSLSSDDFRKYSTLIAKEMAKIHALNVPVRKDPDLIPKTMIKWIQEVENDTLQKFNKKFSESDMYREEMDWITKEMENSHSPVVYCHNDLQGGNILFCEDFSLDKDPKIILIDFEFGGYNYSHKDLKLKALRLCQEFIGPPWNETEINNFEFTTVRGYDIANHFCEWAFDYMTPDPPHFTVDMNKYPTETEKIEFIRAYLEQLVLEGLIEKTNVETEVENLLKEVKVFAMVPHLFSSIWSEKMQFFSNIEFSYKENGKTRLALYKSLKENYLKEKCHTCNTSI